MEGTNLKGLEFFHRGRQLHAIKGFREEQDSRVRRFGELVPSLEETRGRGLKVPFNVGDRKGINKERPGKNSQNVELINPRFGRPGNKSTVNCIEGNSLVSL